MSSQVEMFERMTEERLLALLSAIHVKYYCRYFVSAKNIKLADDRKSIIWDKDFLLGKSRIEVKGIILNALDSFELRKSK